MKRSLALLFFFVLATSYRAADRTTPDCSRDAIMAAVTASASGDTIRVTPSAGCVWNQQVEFSNKKLTIIGNGSVVTVAATTGCHSNQGCAFAIGGLSAKNLVDISGFTFIKQANQPNGMIQFYGAAGTGTYEVGFRFHHNRLVLASAGSRGVRVNGIYGLLDHNTWDVPATGGSIQGLSVWGSSENTDAGFTPWKQPFEPGMAGAGKAVYIEDNVFNCVTTDESVIDTYSGARLVIRYNAFNGCSVGYHGTDTGAQRSTHSWEMYGNRFTNNNPTQLRGITIRGGTALIFDNTFSGSTPWYAFAVMLYRATIPQAATWNWCNGTNWDFTFSTLSVVAAGQGLRFHSVNQDTWGTGAGYTRYFDGPGFRGYPCRDQPGRTTNQAMAPIYEWNNGAVHSGVWDGGSQADYPGGNSAYPFSTWLQENREFHNYTTNFNGTVGVGRGLLANRPAMCTPLVAYFATDTHTLYQCGAGNVWKDYYRPFTYPHPLTGSAPTPTPTP